MSKQEIVEGNDCWEMRELNSDGGYKVIWFCDAKIASDIAQYASANALQGIYGDIEELLGKDKDKEADENT